MFVLGQRAPHATVDAVAEAGDVGNCGAVGSGGEGCEYEFGGGKFGEVRFEGAFPGGGRGGEVGGCGRHGVEEGAETEGWW